jgi:ergothioneine biosynthesis protein EgtB
MTATLSSTLAARLAAVRARSLELIAPLEPEDLCLQGMADASPPKWHLGHTTWFFDTFLLRQPEITPLAGACDHPPEGWGFLFNSYYDAVGARHPRPQRGLLTRPAIGAVLAWRRQVDGALQRVVEGLADWSAPAAAPWLELIELGLQHEQQHQELLLMDLLDGFSRNPLEPTYGEEPERHYAHHSKAREQTWLEHPGGLVEIGHGGGGGDGGGRGFHFDNEAPRHRQWLEPFAIAGRLVNNGEYAAFIADGGYRRPELWMSEGWSVVQARGWQAPRYWREGDEFSLAGRQPRNPEAPVRHLSWFEADAYARWAGARLPGEAEWELLAPRLADAFGILWQWTSSPYRPYPGFQPAAGAVGEYNGKFMSSQMVLRGSCFFTPAGHGRATYRNFFPPACRWMAAGVRLAR